MKFSRLAEYLQKLESTTKRLEMIDILTEFISETPATEIGNAMYLISGYLKAPFESNKFNMADKMIIRVLQQACPTPRKLLEPDGIEEIYHETGDLGNVAYRLCSNNTKSPMGTPEVYERLIEVASIEGTGSQDLKVQRLAEILQSVDKLSAKYIVRIVLGTLRLGFTETTIIEALARHAGDKKLKKEIESVYNIHPDIGVVARKIKEKGIKGLSEIKIEPGVPVLSQKPQRVGGFIQEAIERTQLAWAEFKLDGTRVQLHLDKNKKAIQKKQIELAGLGQPKFMVKTFTRNLEETTHQYPDIVEGAINQVDADSVILDGEAIGFDRKTGEFLPFQETIQRKRKHGVTEMAKEIPLKYFVFDILYLNGKSLIEKPLEARRKLLKKVVKAGDVVVVDDHIETKNEKELSKYFEEARKRNLEGLIVKNPRDPYQAGARSYSWIKLKVADEKLLADSVDCVVLGYYAGKGVRSQFGIGGFLVGIYDKKTDGFKTISKIGTGLKEDEWVKMKKLADKVKINEKPANVEMAKIYAPDVFTKPEIVVEIGADELSVSKTHTAGYALRFPRLIKFRADKPAKEATSLTEIKKMFERQRNGFQKTSL